MYIVVKKIMMMLIVFMQWQFLAASVQEVLDGLGELQGKLINLQHVSAELRGKLQEMGSVINDIQAGKKEAPFTLLGLHTTSPIMQYASSDGMLCVIVPAWRSSKLFANPDAYVAAIYHLCEKISPMLYLIDKDDYRSKILEEYIDFTDPRCTQEMLEGYSRNFDSAYWERFINDWKAARGEGSAKVGDANFAEKEARALSGLRALIEGSKSLEYLGSWHGGSRFALLLYRMAWLSRMYDADEYLLDNHIYDHCSIYSYYEKNNPWRDSFDVNAASFREILDVGSNYEKMMEGINPAPQGEAYLFESQITQPSGSLLNYQEALNSLKGANVLSNYIETQQWSNVATIVQSVGFHLFKNSDPAAKIDFLTGVMSFLQLRRQSFVAALILLKNGYYEPTFIRWITGAILWNIGEQNSQGKYPFNAVLRACLHEVLKCIAQCPTNGLSIDLSASQDSDDILTGVLRECFQFKDDNGKSTTIGFEVLNYSGQPLKYEGTILTNEGADARTALEFAIQLRKQQVRAQEKRIEHEGEQALARFNREQRKEQVRSELEIKVWSDPEAAQTLVDQKKLEVINAATNAIIATNNSSKKAHAWSEAYVDRLIADWGVESEPNICSRCGGEWNVADVLRIFCEAPEEMGDQLEKMKELLLKVVLKILASDVTLSNINDFSIIQKIAELLSCTDSSTIQYLAAIPVNFRHGQINLLKLYIDAVIAVKNGRAKPVLPAEFFLPSSVEATQVRKGLLDALRDLYGS